jgi:Mn-dependent DtxR family transcriptional regulator
MTKVTPQEKQLMNEMYKDKTPVKRIAREIGVDPRTVKKYLKKEKTIFFDVDKRSNWLINEY